MNSEQWARCAVELMLCRICRNLAQECEYMALRLRRLAN